MTFDELKTALLANEAALTSAHLAAFGHDDACTLFEIADSYAKASRSTVPPTWAQLEKLDRADLKSIAENYEWAANEIERLAQVAA
jgi:hypothetical protein